MTERCAGCAHWSPTQYQPDIRPDLDTKPDDWMGEEAPGNWGYCQYAGEFGPRDTSNRFFVSDGSDYPATLHTRSDFGCIDHAPKELT